jgi:L-malate glycosyltransferase
MRILLLGEARSIHTRRWAEGLSARGMDVHVVSLRPGDIKGVTVHILKPVVGSKALYLSVIPRLRALIRKLRPDVVHAHYATSYGLLATLSGHPHVVITAWGTDVLIAPRESFVLRTLLRFSLRRAGAVTSMAEHMSASLLALGVSPDRLHVLPFGVDVGRFAALAAPNRRPGSVVCTRGFHDIYDVQCLVRAFAAVRGERYLQTLTLIGDGPLRPALEALVETLGIRQSVEFLGRLDQEQLAAVLGTQEVFVSPAWSDGNNISLNEAMAAGCFPLATDIPANAQWITHGVNGFLYPAGDVDALIALLRELPAGRRLLDDARQLNLERVNRDANWQTALDRMCAIYDDVRA